MNDFNFSMRQVRGVVILDLEGPIELGESSSQLSTILHSLVDAGKLRVILNLDKVAAIDSSGLGTLVAGFATLEKMGGRLKLINLSPKIAELMTVTKLYIVFDVYADETEAIAGFAKSNDRARQPLDVHAVKIVGGDGSIL